MINPDMEAATQLAAFSTSARRPPSVCICVHPWFPLSVLRSLRPPRLCGPSTLCELPNEPTRAAAPLFMFHVFMFHVSVAPHVRYPEFPCRNLPSSPPYLTCVLRMTGFPWFNVRGT